MPGAFVATIELKYFTEVTDDFRKLTEALDQELRKLNGELQLSYARYNHLDEIRDVVIAYADGVPVACGSMRYYSTDTFELKRVFVSPGYRHRGIASNMVRKLEVVARQKGIMNLVLETGDVLLSANAMYKRIGFHIIPNYGQYANMPKSICMSKAL